MSVNLDRLREVTEAYVAAVTENSAVLLESPRVWWCEGENQISDETCGRWHANLACGWVVLVPVEGEGK
jgi:hypothetical protein